MSTELLPCPFCGKVPTIYGTKSREYASGRWARKHREAYWIHPRCTLGCLFGSVHASAYGATRGVEFVSEEAAIEAWNTRAERTCHVVRKEVELPKGSDDVRKKIVFNCSECDEWLGKSANYCPNCGAKVVEK